MDYLFAVFVVANGMLMAAMYFYILKSKQEREEVEDLLLECLDDLNQGGNEQVRLRLKLARSILQRWKL